MKFRVSGVPRYSQLPRFRLCGAASPHWPTQLSLKLRSQSQRGSYVFPPLQCWRFSLANAAVTHRSQPITVGPRHPLRTRRCHSHFLGLIPNFWEFWYPQPLPCPPNPRYFYSPVSPFFPSTKNSKLFQKQKNTLINIFFFHCHFSPPKKNPWRTGKSREIWEIPRRSRGGSNPTLEAAGTFLGKVKNLGSSWECHHDFGGFFLGILGIAPSGRHSEAGAAQQELQDPIHGKGQQEIGHQHGQDQQAELGKKIPECSEGILECSKGMGH